MSDEAKIARLRVHIDTIDKQLVALLNERARLSLQIGIAKGGRNIIRPARETTVYNNISTWNTGPLSDEALFEVYKKIIGVCRLIQYNKEP